MNTDLVDGAVVAGPDADADTFVALSVVLTGFSEYEVRGTGVVDLQLAAARDAAGTVVATLLDTFRRRPDPVATVRDVILPDPVLGPLARAITKAWYTGSWFALPAGWPGGAASGVAPVATHVIAPATFTEGFSWVAARAHPSGAKAPGFASWAVPPAESEAAR
jgi:hypothetical protein